MLSIEWNIFENKYDISIESQDFIFAHDKILEHFNNHKTKFINILISKNPSNGIKNMYENLLNLEEKELINKYHIITLKNTQIQENIKLYINKYISDNMVKKYIDKYIFYGINECYNTFLDKYIMQYVQYDIQYIYNLFNKIWHINKYKEIVCSHYLYDMINIVDLLKSYEQYFYDQKKQKLTHNGFLNLDKVNTHINQYIHFVIINFNIDLLDKKWKFLITQDFYVISKFKEKLTKYFIMCKFYEEIHENVTYVNIELLDKFLPQNIPKYLQYIMPDILKESLIGNLFSLVSSIALDCPNYKVILDFVGYNI